MAIIEVEHLTKEYRLGAVTSLKDTLRHGIAKMTGRQDLAWERQRFKALDDVNFTIDEGEVVGIIGHNGAGKSTLLKHLANITNPTKGGVAVHGTVAPLIEVGAGLNPELTGRENIYLNAAILGVPRREIRRKLDEIVAFAELEQFIDTPVKRYSSGMTVKLGFSIATSIDADILIVDEVLAVGDLAFQRKCFDRMEKLIHESGKTVLLVSHNIRQVERICSRVMLLNNGHITMDGRPEKVCEKFYEQSNRRIMKQIKLAHRNVLQGKDSVAIEDVYLVGENGKRVEEIGVGDKLEVVIDIDVDKIIPKAEIVVGIHRTDFIYLTAARARLSHTNKSEDMIEGEHRIRYKIASAPLSPGTYGVRLVILDQFAQLVFSAEFLTIFSVTNEREAELNSQWRLIELPSTVELDGKALQCR